jgi:large subunit ribosomal protein L4
MPRKQRRLAIKSALTVKLQEGELVVLDAIDFDAPKTKSVLQLMNDFNVAGKKVLIVTGEMIENVEKSARNIPGVKAIPASSSLNVYDLLYHDKVFVTRDAITRIEEVLA